MGKFLQKSNQSHLPTFTSDNQPVKNFNVQFNTASPTRKTGKNSKYAPTTSMLNLVLIRHKKA
jgi:hypothetical protein